MARAVRKLGTTEIATISKHYDGRTFGFASRNFYAEFLAAHDVDRNAERYFGPIHSERPRQFETVVLDHFYTPATLERAFGVDRETLREYNQSICVPRYGTAPSTFRVATSWPSRRRHSRGRPRRCSLRFPPGERKTEQHRDRYYKVRRGDTLSKIAQRYRVRERELVAVNNLRSRHRIRAGQVLVLPDNASGSGVAIARSAPPADGIYRVRRGDNLSIIARRFGVSELALAAENDLRNRDRIVVGQRLRIPGTQPVVVASAAPTPTAAEKRAYPPRTRPRRRRQRRRSRRARRASGSGVGDGDEPPISEVASAQPLPANYRRTFPFRTPRITPSTATAASRSRRPRPWDTTPSGWKCGRVGCAD